MDEQTRNANAAAFLQTAQEDTSIDSPVNNRAFPVSDYEQFLAKKQREENTSFTDKLFATARQDSFIPGLIARYNDYQYVPQENYSFFSNQEKVDRLTNGISPEYLPEFLNATSDAHAESISLQLHQKQRDLQTLADFGTLGTAGRLAFDVLEPGSMVAGLMSGGLGLTAKLGTVGKTAVSALSAGAAMAGVEKARQAVNFEHDNARVLEAGLVATAFVAPFAYRAARVSTAALKESRALKALEADAAGESIADTEWTNIKEVLEANNIVRDVENGVKSPDALDNLWGVNHETQASIRERQMQEAWAAKEQQAAAAKEVELNNIQSEGELHKGDEMNAVTQALEFSNAATGAQPNAMQLAFQKALGKGKESRDLKASTPVIPEHLQEASKPTPVGELSGDHVFWRSEEGPGIDHGVVVGESAKGQLIVEHVDTGERVLIERADLHPDSPGYHFEVPKEAVYGAENKSASFLPKGHLPEPSRVTLADVKQMHADYYAREGQLRGVTTDVENKMLDNLRNGHSIDDVLTTISKESQHTNLRVLAEQLKRAGLASKIEITPGKAGELGSYHAATDTIKIHSGEGLESTLLHEMVHAATHKAIKAGGAVAKQLEDLFVHVKASNMANGEYALKSIDEFVSEALSNPAFQNTLRLIPKKSAEKGIIGSAWDGLVNVIKSLFGKEKPVDNGVLDEVLSAGRRLINGETDVAGSSALNTYMPVFDQFGVKVPLRFDLYAQLNRSNNAVIRSWAKKFIKDPIGDSNGLTQGLTASEEKTQTMRRLMGRFMTDAQDAHRQALLKKPQTLGEKANFEKQFFADITAVASGDLDVLKLPRNVGIEAELKRAAKSMNDNYVTVLKDAQLADVKGARAVEANDFYVNRSWLTSKMKEAIRDHGFEDVSRLVADSFKSPKLHGNVDKAKTFLRTILKTEFTSHMQDITMASRDMHTLRTELRSLHNSNGPSLTDHEIDNLIDVMFEAKVDPKSDGGNATNLKFRMDLDEAHSMTMLNGQVLKVSDLMERDARVLMSKYLNTMTGHTAMAKRGIKSRADFERDMAQAAEKYHMDNNLTVGDNGQYVKDIQWMRDIYDNITGRPMSTQVFNNTSRVSAALRAVSRSTFLGQLGLTAAGEIKQAVAVNSLRAFMLHSPSFSGLIRMLRTGRMPTNDMVRSIEELWGFGLEHNSTYSRQHEITEFTYDRGVSQLENFANRASSMVDNISGNSTITAGSKQYSALIAIQHHLDLISGRAKLTDAKIKRLAHQGIEASEVREVLGNLKKYATVDGSNGRIDSVNWEQWKAESPGTFEQYHTAVEREVRDSIQEHDLGETLPWGHTQAGKIFMDLRTFTAVAHSKNFLKNISYHDRTTFNIFAANMVGEALMYAVQTTLNFGHNPDELEKRLTLQKIAQASLVRAGAFGLTIPALNTGWWMLSGGSNMFGEVNTANTDNRNLLIPPTGVFLNNAYNSVKTVTGMVNPYQTTTKKEFEQLWSVVPGSNTYGARNLKDYFGSMFPKNEPKQIQP